MKLNKNSSYAFLNILNGQATVAKISEQIEPGYSVGTASSGATHRTEFGDSQRNK